MEVLLSILPYSVFNSLYQEGILLKRELSILPYSVFNKKQRRKCGKRLISFQSYLTPCLTSRRESGNKEMCAFQSYLTPCLTLPSTYIHIINNIICFQSYLTPCLTVSASEGENE